MIIAGHRGFGCTDHDFYQNIRDIPNLPAENTLESIELAFKAGAAYVEVDAVYSADKFLFSIHNVVPKDHFFGEDYPSDFLNKLPFSEIEKFKTGRNENGQVAKLSSILDVASQCSPKTCSWDINIEIKGVQGSGQNYESNDFLEAISELVKASDIPQDRVLFSSFAFENIARMSHLLPHAQYGMLFAEDNEKGEKESSPIYKNHQSEFTYRYSPFDVHHIKRVQDFWDQKARKGVRLDYLHPEVSSIDEETIRYAADSGFGINCWGLFEELNDAKKAEYIQLAQWCEKHDVFVSSITDYCPEMIELSKKLPTKNAL